MNNADILLDIITQYISDLDINYESPNKDGRVNSAINEGQIIQQLPYLFNTDDFIIKNKYRLKIPNIRDWYDFGISKDDDASYFIPVNIKVSKLSTDNLNCKLGIYFALTGLLPDKITNEINWEIFFLKLHENINTYQDKDYYFLVANKSDSKDCFWNSLKRLQSLTPNGNNLPFQTNWANNRSRVHRTHAEAQFFILNCLKESVYKRADIKDSFDKYIAPHLIDCSKK